MIELFSYYELTGGTAVANVLANDWLAGTRATTANVNLSQQSSTSAGITLDLSDGRQRSERSGFSIALDGRRRGSERSCQRHARRPAGTTANVRLSQQSSTSAGVTLDVADGSVDLARGTAIGTHSLIYQICEIANASNCDPATVTVTVQPYVVDAVNDYARASSKIPGTLIASVLTNDKIGGVPATTANVRLSWLSLSPPARGIRLDLTDGSVDLFRRVESRTYTLVYQICEIASPSNCDQATVTLELSGGDP